MCHPRKRRLFPQFALPLHGSQSSVARENRGMSGSPCSRPSGLQKHHQNSTRRPLREGRKKETCGGRGKKREILGGPAEGGRLLPIQLWPIHFCVVLLLWLFVVCCGLLWLFRTHMKVCVCAQHLRPACSYKQIKSVQTWRRGPAQSQGVTQPQS